MSRVRTPSPALFPRPCRTGFFVESNRPETMPLPRSSRRLFVRTCRRYARHKMLIKAWRHMAETSPLDPTDPAYPNSTDEPEDRFALEHQRTDGPAFVCATCSQPIFLTKAPVNGLVQCPYCGAQFFAATDPGEIAEEARAEAEAEAARDRRLAELSELRVRQVSTLRRSMIRTRGYFVTGAWACVGAALELAWLAGLRVLDLHAASAGGRQVSLREFPLPVRRSLRRDRGGDQLPTILQTSCPDRPRTEGDRNERPRDTTRSLDPGRRHRTVARSRADARRAGIWEE